MQKHKNVPEKASDSIASDTIERIVRGLQAQELRLMNPATTTTTPSPDTMPSPPLTADQIEQYLSIAQNIYKNAKSHPRYALRRLCLTAIVIGDVINFICLIIAFAGRRGGPKWITVWATIVVSQILQ